MTRLLSHTKQKNNPRQFSLLSIFANIGTCRHCCVFQFDECEMGSHFNSHFLDYHWSWASFPVFISKPPFLFILSLSAECAHNLLALILLITASEKICVILSVRILYIWRSSFLGVLKFVLFFFPSLHVLSGTGSGITSILFFIFWIILYTACWFV